MCLRNGADMTNAEAAALQLKWKQRGDPPPHCEHLTQAASLVLLSKDNYLTTTFHCRECGEAIVRTYKAAAISSPSLTD